MRLRPSGLLGSTYPRCDSAGGRALAFAEETPSHLVPVTQAFVALIFVFVARLSLFIWHDDTIQIRDLQGTRESAKP